MGVQYRFGDEVGPLMIKMYTKSPERDNGSKIVLQYASYDTAKTAFYHADETDSYQYFAYGSFANNNRKKYLYQGSELSRDYDDVNFFGSLKYDTSTIELAGLKKKSDNFIGIAMNNSVGNNKSKVQHYYMTYKNYFFQDESLKLVLSADYNDFDKFEYTPKGIRFYNGQIVNTVHHKHKEKIVTANLKKSWQLGNNLLISGVQYKYKKYDISQHEIDGVDQKNSVTGPTSEKILTWYGDWEYMLNEANIVSLALKLDHYDRYNMNDNEYIGRLSYTSLFHENWYFKMFLSRTYLSPSFKQLVELNGPFKGNPNLVAAKTLIASGQLQYTYNSNTVRLKVVRKKMEDGLLLDSSMMFINSAMTNYNTCYDVGYTLTYREDDKLTLEYSKSITSAPVIKSSDEGWLARSFNRFGKFDIYNELVYRSGYSYGTIGIDDGYDYNAGLTYRYTADLKFSLKGENLLDKAIKTPYTPQLPSFSASERRIIVTMGYTF